MFMVLARKDGADKPLVKMTINRCTVSAMMIMMMLFRLSFVNIRERERPPGAFVYQRNEKLGLSYLGVFALMTCPNRQRRSLIFTHLILRFFVCCLIWRAIIASRLTFSLKIYTRRWFSIQVAIILILSNFVLIVSCVFKCFLLEANRR